MEKSALVWDKVKSADVDDRVMEEKVGYGVRVEVESTIVGDW
eukprot:CAMPEP_0194275462 /NCGR_PEP_ID=MMETSP0169-20130528/8297_1 /TAXON_ID=218684 /ORGANISM="Corethron pennatum, Strain L29A3" /LENGTH=41 /DNA_ID= /DNA_START= /DNA_END= /DNA_ORIENTATION=